MLRRVATAVAASALVAGCGQAAREPQPPALPFSAKTPLSDRTNRVRPANFARPIAHYRAHIHRALTAMLVDVGDLRTAAGAGDLAAARAAWLRADARYEAIGAAYGAFGDLDHAINATPGNTGRLVGLHLIERILWRDRAPQAAVRPAQELDRSVRRLRDRVPRLEIDSLDYALRAHEVLEDTLHLQLSGQASPWSGSALNAVAANVVGTRVVLSSVAPMLAQRDPLVLSQAQRALGRLAAAVRPVRHARWDTLPQRRREAIAGVTAQAAERLAFVPEVISPLPPVPVKRAVAG